MKAVVQVVKAASVTIAGEVVGEIGEGLLMYVGISATDTEEAIVRWADRLGDLCLLPDESGRLSISLVECGRPLLLISNFTLGATFKSGRKPSFSATASGEAALPLLRALVSTLEGRGVEVAQGVFGAEMTVSSVNWGPTTFVMETD